jgi:hypothetical protein
MGEEEQKQKHREKEPKDNGNLYLAREGIIRECKSNNGVHIRKLLLLRE